MAEYISREAAVHVCEYTFWLENVKRRIKELPAADVVPKAAYNQARWERDIAVSQLKEIGKGLGAKMDDVTPVRQGKWKWVGFNIECSECGCMPYFERTEMPNYCPNCGAKMKLEG